MKHYEFHSALPPEQVFARLSVRTKVDRSLDPWVGREIFLYSKKGDGFWLSYTGKYPVRGFFPFRGKVSVEGNGCLIVGNFSLGVPNAVIILLFGLVALLVGVPPGAAIAALAYFSLGEALMQWAFFGARREAILNFIQENLLE